MTRKLLVPLDAGANKITNVANGTASTDVAAFGQIPTSAAAIGGLLAASNLSDVGSAAAAVSSLGLTSAQTAATYALRVFAV